MAVYETKLIEIEAIVNIPAKGKPPYYKAGDRYFVGVHLADTLIKMKRAKRVKDDEIGTQPVPKASKKKSNSKK